MDRAARSLLVEENEQNALKILSFSLRLRSRRGSIREPRAA
jgi:hypothetical protein